jgi:hypothetical protein
MPSTRAWRSSKGYCHARPSRSRTASEPQSGLTLMRERMQRTRRSNQGGDARLAEQRAAPGGTFAPLVFLSRGTRLPQEAREMIGPVNADPRSSASAKTVARGRLHRHERLRPPRICVRRPGSSSTGQHGDFGVTESDIGRVPCPSGQASAVARRERLPKRHAMAKAPRADSSTVPSSGIAGGKPAAANGMGTTGGAGAAIGTGVPATGALASGAAVVQPARTSSQRCMAPARSGKARALRR